MSDGQTPTEFRTDAFDYDLPETLIAQRPADRRDASLLLALPRVGAIEHATFSDLARFLRPGDLLVANDSKVLRARFRPRRREGGRAEVLLLHQIAGGDTWEAMARPGKRIRKGDRLALDATRGIEIVDWAPAGNRIVRFYGTDADDAMSTFGEMPLPPYIKHAPPGSDERYQTVYARSDGSVASPTAGLHFTAERIAELEERGVGWATLTLHVGAGTFRPVKTADIRRHYMHPERYEISATTVDRIRKTRARGDRVVAVGTTVLRTLESAAATSGEVAAGSGSTDIFIYPPYAFKIVDALLTNFHLPRSTLLMLVSAFAGRERILGAYAEAVRRSYRFYSFGDAMFIERTETRE